MQNTPLDMQSNPQYDDVVIEVDHFFEDRIQKAIKYNINKIILDVGIGFGKSKKHNLTLLKHLEHFNHFQYDLLIGASRKSIIADITKAQIDDRLAGSIAIHLDAISKGANIIRVHDVKEHHQALSVIKSINMVY